MPLMISTTKDGLKIAIGSQNFDDNTVSVYHDGKEYHCPMFQDENGDIGFTFKGEQMYFFEL